MRKLCLLLVAEINRLGGNVIHCSLSKIVFSTNRTELPKAVAFTNSLMESLAQKPLFASLTLGDEEYFGTFVWIDSASSLNST